LTENTHRKNQDKSYKRKLFHSKIRGLKRLKIKRQKIAKKLGVILEGVQPPDFF
jgi:hypothetical protein